MKSKEQPKITTLILQSYTESNSEDIALNLNGKEATTPTQDADDSSSSEEVQFVSPSKKNQMLRITGEKAKYLPEEHELNGNFNFQGMDKERYQAFLHSNIYHCKSINDAALTQLNMFDKVYALIDNIGWRKFFAINCPMLSYAESFMLLLNFHMMFKTLI